jgi:hypothetical protein
MSGRLRWLLRFLPREAGHEAGEALLPEDVAGVAFAVGPVFGGGPRLDAGAVEGASVVGKLPALPAEFLQDGAYPWRQRPGSTY